MKNTLNVFSRLLLLMIYTGQEFIIIYMENLKMEWFISLKMKKNFGIPLLTMQNREDVIQKAKVYFTAQVILRQQY